MYMYCHSERIHVFGKLLGARENVTDVDSAKQLICNITVVIHETVLVSTMHTYVHTYTAHAGCWLSLKYSGRSSMDKTIH